MEKTIMILPGDGIGPEVINQAIKVIKVIDATYNHKFTLLKGLIGAASIKQNGVPVKGETIERCVAADAVVLGAIGDPIFDNNPDAKIRPEQGLLKLRKSLGLYANVRPIRIYDALKDISPLKNEQLKDVDLLIYRELTGGIYFGQKKLSKDGTEASDLCVYSKEEITRIAKLAFEAALVRKKKLTLIDKANVLETSRLWRKVVKEMSNDYADVKVDYMYVDNAAMQVVMNPSNFDVVLTENMFGDIISDLASVLTGSLGMLPSSSIGQDLGLFEPCHGSYPQAARKDLANPMAMILSIAMMYDSFKLEEEATAIRNAVSWAIKERVVTQDLRKDDPFSCSLVGDLISYYIEEKGPVYLNKDYMFSLGSCII